jgi:hypothetical protein
MLSALKYAFVLTMCWLLFASAPIVAGQHPSASGEATVKNDGLTLKKDGAQVAGPHESTQTRVSNGRANSGFVVYRYHLRRGPDGGFCVYRATSRRDTPMTEEERRGNREAERLAQRSGIDPCPYENGATRSVTPAEVAEPFVRTIPMPVPDPRIPPGHAITGLPAYLETRGTLSHRVGPAATALGPIEVHATGAYYVDWGDGSPEEGPFGFEGAAYPTGRILHTYRDTGTYTVAVRVAWSADWRLGGDSGTVPGLRTEASIPLEVRQLQAVRLR